jgi:hypothetical protein
MAFTAVLGISQSSPIDENAPSFYVFQPFVTNTVVAEN